MVFEGSAVALVTPFLPEGGVDYEGLCQLTSWHIEKGTDAIVVMGTTGEVSTTTDDEHIDAVRVVVEAAAGKVPVIAGTAINDTRHSVTLSCSAQGAGADALLLVTPYYNKGTEEGLYRHFRTIAESVDIPCILYTVPSRTGVHLSLELVARLAEVPNIVGIKDATGDLSYTVGLRAMTPPDFAIYSGNDDVVVPMMAAGASGVISVLANILPTEVAEMTRLCLEGDFAEAERMQTRFYPLIKALFREVSPVPVKAAMKLLEMPAGPLRLPLYDATEETVDVLRKEMAAVGLLEAGSLGSSATGSMESSATEVSDDASINDAPKEAHL